MQPFAATGFFFICAPRDILFSFSYYFSMLRGRLVTLKTLFLSKDLLTCLSFQSFLPLRFTYWTILLFTFWRCKGTIVCAHNNEGLQVFLSFCIVFDVNQVFVFAHIWLTYIKKMLETCKFIHKIIAVSRNSCTFASENISFRFLVR